MTDFFEQTSQEQLEQVLFEAAELIFHEQMLSEPLLVMRFNESLPAPTDWAAGMAHICITAQPYRSLLAKTLVASAKNCSLATTPLM